MPRIYFDSNVIIAAFEGIEAVVRETASSLLDLTLAGNFEPIMSDLTLAEILVKPFRDENAALIELYKGLSSNASPFHIVSITRNRLVETARLRARLPNLKLPDALHVACAGFARCDAIITADTRIPADAPIRIMQLTAATLNEIRAL